MNKHTPGPWHMQTFYRPIAKDNVPRVYDSQGRDIAEAISKDDARLIASAPELLSALSVLLKRASLFLDTSATHDGLANLDAIAIARMAIEKATGGNNES